MRIMDSSMQDDDCSIEAVTPAKKKKMKQARLPFQMLSSVESPNSITNKKRKLSSPSVEYKNPKVLKITSKENSLENLEEDKTESMNNSMVESDGSVEIIEVDKADDERDKSDGGKGERKTTTTPKRRSKGRQSKPEDDQKKSSALMKFLRKTDQDAEASDDTSSTPNHKDKDVKRNEEPASTPKTPNHKDKDVKRNEELASTPKTPKSARSRKKDTASPEVNSPLNSEDETPSQSSEEDEDKRSECNESNMDDSMVNDSPKAPRTPSARASSTDKAGNDAKQKKLTPKQQQRQLQVVKRKEEKQRLRMEKEKKLEEERENRRKEKEEKRKAKEERERAEKQQKLKEKQLKEMKKQQELELKQKEKDAKEEERRKREEEKRKKEEEKLEAVRKKQKAASNFASFFVAKKQEAKSVEEENVVELRNFMPFEVKADMKMAPLARRVLTDEEKSALDEQRVAGNFRKSDLYIGEVKTKRIVPRKSGETWPVGAKDDVILIDDENDGSSTIVDRQDNTAEKHRPKLLQFHENRRPPYWGTWRKTSDTVKPRKPFATDSKWFNYEVDSEEEWEEEEEGESLRGSDEEKDEETAEDNEYDIDNEFMVPHGYLSDEEVQMEEKENEFMSPESRKLKLKVLGEQFESQRNAKTWQLKPKIVGCVWQGPENKFPENVLSKTVQFLMARQIWTNEIPVVLPTPTPNETPSDSQTPVSKKTRVPDEALPDLIRLVHCNTHGRDFLVKEFMTHWNKRNKLGENQISKASLLQKIREIARRMACPDEGPMHLKACWYVPEETRKLLLPDGEELGVPNRWSYNLAPKRKSDVADLQEKPDKEDKEKRNVVPLITQFIKKIPQDEAKRQSKPDSKASASGNPLQRPPKRATLISVARGQQFPQETRRTLVTTTLGKEKTNNDQDSDDDVVLIDDDHPDDKSNESKSNDDRLEAASSKDSMDVEKKSGIDRRSPKPEVLDTDKSTNRSSGTPMEIDEPGK